MSLTVRGPGMSSAGLRASEDAYARGISRISSGFRINRAADDAAGLAISQRMRSQVNGSAMAMRNVQDGINLLQTAEGGLSGMTAMLQRARELSVQAASTGTMTADDRAAAAAEVRQLVSELDRTARTTSFNGQRMLDGSQPRGFAFQVGANAGDVLGVRTYDLGATALGLLGITTTTAGTSSTAPTTYTTTSAAFGVVDADTNAERVFQVSVGGVLSPVLGIKKQVYGLADHGLLRDNLSAALSAYGVSVSLTGGGTTSARLQFQAIAGNTVELQFSGALATTLGITTTPTPGATTTTAATSFTSADLAALVASGSADAISLVDDALTSVMGARTELGATQNRMEHQLSRLATTGANLHAARSRIEDADIAKEYAGLVRAQVLSQAGMAMQAQGAQSSQRVLQLLGGL